MSRLVARQVFEEPVPCQRGNLLELAWLLKEVGRSRNGDELLYGVQLFECFFVKGNDFNIVAADDEERGRLHPG